MFDDITPGDELPAFERTTDFAHWNRYAAVNDEFIDVHMSRPRRRPPVSPTSSGWATCGSRTRTTSSTTGLPAGATSRRTRASSAP